MMAAGQLAIPRSRYRKIKSHRRFNVVRNSRGTSRERDMLFVPEARDAEITGVIRASRPLSHTNHMKWHDFPGAVLVIHRGGRKTERERERERERGETHFPTYVCHTTFAPSSAAPADRVPPF